MVAKLVMLGLVVALIASAAPGLPVGPLPGVALGCAPLLIVERAIAFFAAWMVCLVVMAQALRGHLPTEISGRRVKYAWIARRRRRMGPAMRSAKPSV